MRASWCRLVAVLALGLSGCVPPAVDLTPEGAVLACEAPTALALRAKDAGFRSLTLEPAATSRVEKRATQVGRQPVALVVSGHGTARETDGSTDVRYLCLIAPSGEAVFVDVTAANGVTILAECSAPPAGTSRLACLSDLLRVAERGLAEAEGKAVIRARNDGPRTRRSELEEPAATSIGAWRVYRDAECERQREASAEKSADLYQACRVGLTRDRVRQLGL
ncbi:MAG: lysozyme inhibitor LprI family protein [Geminicoccaceae bacterium]